MAHKERGTFLRSSSRIHRLQRSLLAFLGRTSYAAEARDDGILVIDPLGALDPEVARAELDVYLRMWESLTPGAAARLVS